MKLLPLFLLQALLVVVGIAAYHHFWGGPEVAGSSNPEAGAALESGAVIGWTGGPGGEGPGQPGGLPHGEDARPVHLVGQSSNAQIAQVNAMRKELDSMRALFKAWSSHASQAEAERRSREGSGGAVVGATGHTMDLGDPEDLENGVFRDATVNAFRAYMAEARKREQQERRVAKTTSTVMQAGAELPAEKMTEVVSSLLSFQDDAQELLRDVRGELLNDQRAAKQQEFEDMQRAFQARIRRMVSPEDAERILATRMARTGGFFRDPLAAPAPPKNK